MDKKQHYNPVRQVIGEGVIQTLGDEVKQFGQKCLLVAQTNNDAMLAIKDKIATVLSQNEIEYDIFDEIRPNPSVHDVKKGIKMINDNHYNAIVAVGGGSVIDTAKVLSISHQMEIDWKNAFTTRMLFKNKNKLPLIAISTTAGTGSHCTQAAVISDEDNVKHTLFGYDFFPTVALVDYTLTMSLPASLTASTGFDAFCHLSEAYIVGNLSDITKILDVEAMKIIAEVLPKLVVENKAEYRKQMAVADCCAGISLSNGGATVPHSFGETISSCVYRINHGCSLAICYPSFVEHFYSHPGYGERIKEVIELINNEKNEVKDAKTARHIMEKFIESLGLKYELCDYDVTCDELAKIKDIYNHQIRFKKEDVKEIIEDICRSAKLSN